MPNNIHFKVEIFLSSFIKKNFQNILFLETAALIICYSRYNSIPNQFIMYLTLNFNK